VSEGYTYTTISSGPDGPTRIGMAFYPDHTARIRACGLHNDRPALCIVHGDVDVTFAPTPGPVTATDARLARKLADQAAAYAAEVERLHNEHEAEAAADSAA
jgi:hypothetical protein